MSLKLATCRKKIMYCGMCLTLDCFPLIFLRRISEWFVHQFGHNLTTASKYLSSSGEHTNVDIPNKHPIQPQQPVPEPLKLSLLPQTMVQSLPMVIWCRLIPPRTRNCMAHTFPSCCGRELESVSRHETGFAWSKRWLLLVACMGEGRFFPKRRREMTFGNLETRFGLMDLNNSFSNAKGVDHIKFISLGNSVGGRSFVHDCSLSNRMKFGPMRHRSRELSIGVNSFSSPSSFLSSLSVSTF
ncbi:hypothetical protein VNO77_37653 [Canavalia gladiata]|uniref:Uncharacterized protein n=1 Tax=Canavalia gladiata TaxID=3824 RepID=A0AAN9PWT3_CANGL